jgi:hypothetical protein
MGWAVPAIGNSKWQVAEPTKPRPSAGQDVSVVFLLNREKPSNPVILGKPGD